MQGQGVIVVMVTIPDQELGARLGRTLVEERLAACVNVMGGLRSVYRWKGELCDDQEALLVIKTRRELLESLTQRVMALHPYEVPEVLALEAVGGSAQYMEWVLAETAREG